MKKVLKNKKYIFKFILFWIMIFLFAYLGTRDYHTEVTDNVRFAIEYKDISKNNIYKYVGEHEVLEILNGKSKILFLGFPSNIWSHYYADYLNEMAISNGIDEIYYYDFKRDRSLDNRTYHEIVKRLESYLVPTDSAQFDLSAPTVIIVKNGKILYFDNDIALLRGNVLPEDYFTDYQKNLLKTHFDAAIKEYLKGD